MPEDFSTSTTITASTPPSATELKKIFPDQDLVRNCPSRMACITAISISRMAFRKPTNTTANRRKVSVYSATEALRLLHLSIQSQRWMGRPRRPRRPRMETPGSPPVWNEYRYLGAGTLSLWQPIHRDTLDDCFITERDIRDDLSVRAKKL